MSEDEHTALINVSSPALSSSPRDSASHIQSVIQQRPAPPPPSPTLPRTRHPPPPPPCKNSAFPRSPPPLPPRQAPPLARIPPPPPPPRPKPSPTRLPPPIPPRILPSRESTPLQYTAPQPAQTSGSNGSATCNTPRSQLGSSNQASNISHRALPSSSVSPHCLDTPRPTGVLSSTAHSSSSLIHHALVATPIPLHADALPVALSDRPLDSRPLPTEPPTNEPQSPPTPQYLTLPPPVNSYLPHLLERRAPNQTQDAALSVSRPHDIPPMASIPTHIDPPHLRSSQRQRPTVMPLPVGVNHPTGPQMFALPPPSSMVQTPSSSLLPHSHEPRMFDNAHDMVLNCPQFINNAQFNSVAPAGSGLKTLYEHSMPDAFHDSAARFPPARCHLETRKEYIDRICNQWAFGKLDHENPVMWLHGPFGVGKTAVAQSSAEALKAIHKLIATLFFSRSDKNRSDPRRVFTSLAYQIATVCDLFAALVDVRIRKDPSITTKSLSIQFEELIATPLKQIQDAAANGLEGRIVIIDGLDECRGTVEQCEIIRIIAASARDLTTPFRWFVTSRPEDPIIRAMDSRSILPIVHRIELPVSREIDHEILIFLTDEFTKIRESHGLPDSWPSDEVLALIVKRGAGLWIYVSTIVRFIKDENSFGPEDQLRIVLEFLEEVSTKLESNNPLAEMDFFYTLIMQRIPSNILETVQRIVLLNSSWGFDPVGLLRVLGLSISQLRQCCSSIRSVMELQSSAPELWEWRLHFYHASFVDFLTNYNRSGEFYIHGEFLNKFRRELLDWLHSVISTTTNSSNFIFPTGITLPSHTERDAHYSFRLVAFWELCFVPNCPIDTLTATSMSNLPFQKMLTLLSESFGITCKELEHLKWNFPIEFQDKIVRREKCPTPQCPRTGLVWILGHGDNEAIVITYDDGDMGLWNNQNPPPGICPCNYWGDEK
ncbi:hypothetical protein NP233_g12747 [Leucocoprinus birnbaumii]|uniref:Nephrocystin 3-like N-terminal domain-containing protein n=1 Tax=Leucocoprinus birnbaumii TaxID=56174 RepID=A0AAD5YMR7_9AGAR|nr:hypothetical protein NP233_g12747 [Leucocoprinus birnbaumii]